MLLVVPTSGIIAIGSAIAIMNVTGIPKKILVLPMII
jgi:hypothetical protein